MSEDSAWSSAGFDTLGSFCTRKWHEHEAWEPLKNRVEASTVEIEPFRGKRPVRQVSSARRRLPRFKMISYHLEARPGRFPCLVIQADRDGATEIENRLRRADE